MMLNFKKIIYKYNNIINLYNKFEDILKCLHLADVEI
jgi:hypothetical protein